nr:alpha-xylosidase [uncultured Sphaerochaeta sp.]
MKFRDGYWNIQKHIRHLPKREIVDIQKLDGKIVIYAAVKPIEFRGATLNTPVITTEISSPMEGVLHIRTYHYKGARNDGPFFELLKDDPTLLTYEEAQDGLLSVIAGSLQATIPLFGPCDLTYQYDGRYLTSSPGKLSGHFQSDDGRVFQTDYLNLSVGEAIYGLGERFTPFVKNGQVVDIWNEDGGTSSEQAYKNIPFYLSSNGYGVLVANPGKVSFEVGSEVVTAVQFSVPGECLDYYLIAGNTGKEVLGRYTRLSGRPALVPPWSFGLWLSTSFVTDYDEKTVHHFIDGMAQRKIPLQVFHFDCFWMREFQWVDFSWDSRQFPDPKAMLKGLHDRGLKVCVWINPYVAQKSAMFDEGMEQGYLVQKSDGSIWQWDRWQAGMGLVDFTNPEAVAWFRGKLEKLLDMGVDTFKTDFGERIPTEVVYYDGSDPVKMHNYYTYLYNEAVFSLLEEKRGKGEALVFARSATVGGQKFPVHWGGDCSATYESMAESLRGGLSLSLSGFGYWSHDIGGFEQTATPDLFKRWVAFGLLSSHSRLHGNESYRVPWDFGEEACDVLRFFVELKCSLMPYLYAMANKTHQEGLPMMRSMMLEFPDDPVCIYLDRQYLLGESLLVAPLLNDRSTASYYLPEGRWTHLLSGEEVTGGRYFKETYDYFSLPLFARPNSLIPIGKETQSCDYDFTCDVTFHLFALDEGRSAESQIYDAKGEVVATCTIVHEDGVFVVKATGSLGPWAVFLHNEHYVETASIGMLEETEKGTLVSFSSEEREATIQ